MTEHIVHPFEPFFRADSKILIVGSLPSVKSRENGFYYGHPQNRFWKMLAMIFSGSRKLRGFGIEPKTPSVSCLYSNQLS